MAEYIDRDLLKKQLKVEEGKMLALKRYDEGLTFSVAISMVNSQPTADVIPKSEAEAELADYQLCSEAECKVCGERTSKVIKQLQEEIAELKKRSLPSYYRACTEAEASIAKPVWRHAITSWWSPNIESA